MIDRASRDRYATILRHLASGTLSTDRFQSKADRIVLNTHHPLLADLHQHVDGLYHDLWSYSLRGRHELDAPTRKRVARAILFLRSDEVLIANDASNDIPRGSLGWVDAALMFSAIVAMLVLAAAFGAFGLGVGATLLIAGLLGLHVRETRWFRRIAAHAASDRFWPFADGDARDRAKCRLTFLHGRSRPLAV